MMPHENLIASPQQRQARKEQKEQHILQFLRQQIWSTSEILGSVASLRSRQGIHDTLSRMEKDGFLVRYQLETIAGKKTIWGITNHGQICAFDPDNDDAPNANHFEPSRLSETTAHHHLGIQKIRLSAEENGWSEWIDGNRLKSISKDGKRPDAIVNHPSGMKYAIEFERTFKTIKRYEAILSTYLQALKKGDMDMVIWICPDLKSQRRLERIILGIKTVNVKGQSLQIDPERHHVKLRFTTMACWPYSEQTVDPN